MRFELNLETMEQIECWRRCLDAVYEHAGDDVFKVLGLGLGGLGSGLCGVRFKERFGWGVERGRSGSERGSTMEAEVEKREERVEGLVRREVQRC